MSSGVTLCVRRVFHLMYHTSVTKADTEQNMMIPCKSRLLVFSSRLKCLYKKNLRIMKVTNNDNSLSGFLTKSTKQLRKQECTGLMKKNKNY